ncbi:hypothetical protein PMI40_04643 [Herbaspirillum sp. YR522]|nr:hypothetical protein PMI40_04643 [Herbaspirillum sp. YR522]
MTVREMLQRYLDEVSSTKARPKDDVSRAKPVALSLLKEMAGVKTGPGRDGKLEERVFSLAPDSVTQGSSSVRRCAS